MKSLLKGILICSPFMHFIFIGKSILTNQALLSISLELAVILFFLYGGWNKRKPDLKAPLIFFAYILLMSIYFIGKGLLFVNKIDNLIFPLMHVTVFFLFYFALCHILDENDYGDTLKIILYPAVIVSTICIFQRFGIDIFKYNQPWVNGTLGNPTNNAMYLCACVPFAFLHKRPFIPVAFLFLGMIVCWSASALITALIIIFIYLLAKRKYLFTGIYVLLLTCAVIALHSQLKDFLNPYEKLIAWEKAIEHWKLRWPFGHGLDTFRNLHVVINTSSWPFIHNHYIWILHSLGVAGLILFANWARSLKFVFNPKDIRFIATLSLISVAIMACISVPFRVYPIVLLTAFNMAIITREVVK